MIRAIFTIGLSLLTMECFAQTQVYSEDFDNGIPVNYTIVNNDGLTPHASVSDFSNAWVGVADPDNPTDTVAGSTSYFDPAGQADRWLITPAITLGAYGNILYWEGKSHDASYPDSYYVLASQTDTQLSSFTDTLLYVSNELDTWTLRDVNVSDSGLNNVTVHFAFVNRTDDGFKLYIDSITVFTEDPVGIDALDQSEISMYPNPANDIVSFGAEVDVVRFYNLNGKLIRKETNKDSVLATELLPGTYIVELQEGNSIYRKRLIKL